MEEVRKVVDSELGFVADVPYRRSGAKVSIDYECSFRGSQDSVCTPYFCESGCILQACSHAK